MSPRKRQASDMEDRFLELDKPDFDLLHELPVCGCGQPELAFSVYRSLLRAYHVATFYLVGGVLDRLGAIEHGTSLDGAWLIEKGGRLLAILDRYAESQFEATPVCGAVVTHQEARPL